MGYGKSYLANFILYCENENTLEEKRESNLPCINLEIAKRKWNIRKKDSEVKRRYELNSPGVKEFLENVPFVHYTGIDSLVGIFQNKALLSVKEMERLDISFNYRIPSQGINDQMHRYVFEGVQFIASRLKSMAASPDPMKFDRITHYFTRLFKLESANYIMI